MIDIVVVMVRKEKNGKLIPKNRDKIKIFSAQSKNYRKIYEDNCRNQRPYFATNILG